MLKRLLDICISGLALLLLSPVLVVLAILVRVKLGSPVLFRQTRPGLHGEPFEMMKFRTMTDGRDANGELLPDDQRLVPFGRFLRSSSLDELPELLNVLRGDMSLVGPRPLLMAYLPLYNATSAAVMRCAPVLPAGRRSTVAITSPGRKNSIWMCGMSTMRVCGWI